MEFIDSKDNEEIRKNNPDKYLNGFCKVIKEKAENDFDKARMIHDFAAYLLPYDYESIRPGARKRQDWRGVIINKTGVCEGYTRVVEELCNRLEMGCYYVHGYCGFTSSLVSHAWNIIECEGAWYTCDATWDTTPNIYGTNNVKEDYLFMKPEDFVKYHFPTGYENDDGVYIGNGLSPKMEFQLLETPLSVNEFTALHKTINQLKKTSNYYKIPDLIFEEPDNSIPEEKKILYVSKKNSSPKEISTLEIECSSVKKSINFAKDEYSISKNPRFYGDIDITSIIKKMDFHKGDLITVKGKFTSSMEIDKLYGVLFDPSPMREYYMEITEVKVLTENVSSTEENSFEITFELVEEPKYETILRFNYYEKPNGRKNAKFKFIPY